MRGCATTCRAPLYYGDELFSGRCAVNDWIVGAGRTPQAPSPPVAACATSLNRWQLPEALAKTSSRGARRLVEGASRRDDHHPHQQRTEQTDMRQDAIRCRTRCAITRVRSLEQSEKTQLYTTFHFLQSRRGVVQQANILQCRAAIPGRGSLCVCLCPPSSHFFRSHDVFRFTFGALHL